MGTTTTTKGKKPDTAKKAKAIAARPPRAAKPAKAGAAKPAKVKIVKPVRDAQAKANSGPDVTEIVAAALVGAAAALSDPAKARRLASAVGDEIEQAAKGAAGRGAAIWQLAMDVAKRSVDVLGGVAKSDKKKKNKKKKKAGKR